MPVRLRGVVHDMGAGVSSGSPAQRAWYMVAVLFIVEMFMGMFGGGRRNY